MSSKKPATPSKKRPPPAAARVTDSSKKAGKAARPRAADGARRKLNFVEDDEEAFVPVVTHRVLGYAEKDARAVPPHVAALFAFVERTCDVPRDFDMAMMTSAVSRLGISRVEKVKLVRAVQFRTMSLAARYAMTEGKTMVLVLIDSHDPQQKHQGLAEVALAARSVPVRVPIRTGNESVAKALGAKWDPETGACSRC